MRYDEMKRLYPWIGGYFNLIADQVHSGLSPDLELLALQISGRVPAGHCRPVLEKLGEFVKVSEENRRFIASRKRTGYTVPANCPYCCSIDTEGGGCKWCHNSKEDFDFYGWRTSHESDAYSRKQPPDYKPVPGSSEHGAGNLY